LHASNIFKVDLRSDPDLQSLIILSTKTDQNVWITGHLSYSMVKSKTTLAECGFLSGIGTARLRRMHKEEVNPKARDRLLAYAMRKEGMSVYAISDSLVRP